MIGLRLHLQHRDLASHNQSTEKMSQPVEPPAQPLIKEYRWYNSSNIQTELQCGIIRLQCGDDVFDVHELRELSISAYIVCNQVQVHDPPLSTLFGDVNVNRKVVQWDHVLSFPVKMRDLSADSLLVVTIWRPDGQPYAGTSMRIFSEQGCMRLGKQKLLLFPQVEGDPNVVFRSNSTPGDYFTYFEDIDYEFQMEKVEELHRIQSAQQAAGKSDVKNEWLDSLLMTRILQSKQDYRDESNPSSRNTRYSDELWGQSLDQIELHKYSYLIVEMPSLFHPVSVASFLLFNEILTCLNYYRFYTKRSNIPPWSLIIPPLHSLKYGHDASSKAITMPLNSH